MYEVWRTAGCSLRRDNDQRMQKEMTAVLRMQSLDYVLVGRQQAPHETRMESLRHGHSPSCEGWDLSILGRRRN